MLHIHNLHATVADKPILKGLSLTINAGEIHAIMGPNGAGKSTLGYTLGGRPGYEVTGGTVEFAGQDLLALAPHERAAAGLFLGFQYPVEIPGVSFVQFLREALERPAHGARRKAAVRRRIPQAGARKGGVARLDMDMLKRPVNVGFSGGEKKRAEMVQMGILDPQLAILDETDSGLDIDALRIVGEGINRDHAQARQSGAADHALPAPARLRAARFRPCPRRWPDRQASGGPELARQLEDEGYGAVAA